MSNRVPNADAIISQLHHGDRGHAELPAFTADITTAFLQGTECPKDSDRVIWIKLFKLPKERNTSSDYREKHGKLMKLTKPMYRLCDAPRAWFEEATEKLEYCGNKIQKIYTDHWKLCHEKYLTKQKPISITRERTGTELPVTEAERTQLRGLLGALTLTWPANPIITTLTGNDINVVRRSDRNDRQ